MQVVALVGPTAVGKSSAALALAQRMAPSPVAIINADAMQMYRGMDIGTAKAEPAVRAMVPHHLLDIWPITHRASVVEFRDAARALLCDLAPDARPVVVGGSGLYIQAALDDLDVPATDPGVRAKYEALLAELGPRELHAELARRDPRAASAIEPANGRRIVRALEVVELTGRYTARLPRDPKPWIPTRWVGLKAPLEVLDRAIGSRVERMWAAGLVEEVERLAALGLRTSPTAGSAVGYAECLEVIDGRMSRQQAIDLTARRTRQLARRQLRWFKRDRRITWVDVDDSTTASDTADAIASLVVAWE